MAYRNDDKPDQYAHYALHCLTIVHSIPDYVDRAIHRMADSGRGRRTLVGPA